MTNYQTMHDQVSQEPPPDPNTFMTWLFTSGILTEHQKDMIRAKMMNPALPPETNPGTEAGTGAAIAAKGAVTGATALASKPGTPPQSPGKKPVEGPPTGGLPSSANPKASQAPAGGTRPMKTGAIMGQM